MLSHGVDKSFTYVSLFSSAGIGCFGLHQLGMECVATCEIAERRLRIQRYNHKCKYPEGYVVGDLSEDAVKEELLAQVQRWRREEGMATLDLLVATPPCQGMSVANHKKNGGDHARNSLVIESIQMVDALEPRFFLFENVPAFMRTLCTDTDGANRPIADAIERTLGDRYEVYSRIINFKDYGASSSRTRALVIGVRNDVAQWVSPMELLPTPVSSPTLREVIGDLQPLTVMGEVSPDDALHRFRPYPAHMRAWVDQLAEGQSAFDNVDASRIPHQVIDGQVVINQRKNGDKYRRQYWDRVGPCIHTRNDQLASQNTVHPSDDRVFSVRELMRMMTIPDDFRWFEMSLDEVNALPTQQQAALFRREEMCIRQCLGEAVPTAIMRSIGEKMLCVGRPETIRSADIAAIVNELTSTSLAIEYIRTNPSALAESALSRIAELANSKRTSHAAFYTDRSLLTAIAQTWPDLGRGPIRVLEPSVGSGNFIPFLIARYGDAESLTIDVVDLDPDAIAVAKTLLDRHEMSDRVRINYECADFLDYEPQGRYQLIVGNPPFGKVSRSQARRMNESLGLDVDGLANVAGYFMLHAMKLADHVSLVLPKYCLSTKEFEDFRAKVAERRIDSVLDFGEQGFKGVLVETVCIGVSPGLPPGKTVVESLPLGLKRTVRQGYMTSPDYPAWLLYRDAWFDDVAEHLEFGVFDAFRDRQITKSMMSSDGHGVWVVRSRNISDQGDCLIRVAGYDAFLDEPVVSGLAVSRFLDRDDVYLAPNMTYKPRLAHKPRGVLVNGSVAVMIPRDGVSVSEAQRQYFATDEFRAFYRVARNHATRSMNIDESSVYFFGIPREG